MLKLAPILLILSLLFSINMAAQGSCQEDIDKANKLFENGSYNDAEKLLKKILVTCSLNQTQENEILKLIASVNYEMDELEKGDEYTAEFLKKNPYYTPNKKTDPLPFREAIQKLKSWPRFYFGFRGGISMGFVDTKKVYPVLDTADYNKPYTIKPYFLGALEFGWNIRSFMSLNLGAGLRIQKIQHQVPQYNQYYFNYEEITKTLNVPLTIHFSIPTGGAFFPDLYFGGEYEYFTGATYSYAYTGNSNISQDFTFYLNRKRNNVTIQKDERAAYRYAALGGIRLMYKIKNFSLYADGRYIKEYNLYNNPQKRYTDPDLNIGNNYTLADIQLQNLDISIGFNYYFSYKVKSKY